MGSLPPNTLRLARQPQEIAAYPHKPKAVRGGIQPRGRGLPAVDAGDEGCGHDAVVGEHAHVLKDLVRKVGARLRERNAVQDGVAAGFGAAHQAAEPGVEWECAEEAEGGAAF